MGEQVGKGEEEGKGERKGRCEGGGEGDGVRRWEGERGRRGMDGGYVRSLFETSALQLRVARAMKGI